MPRSSSRGRWSTKSALSIWFAVSRSPRLNRSSNQRRASVLFCSDISSSSFVVPIGALVHRVAHDVGLTHYLLTDFREPPQGEVRRTPLPGSWWYEVPTLYAPTRGCSLHTRGLLCP